MKIYTLDYDFAGVQMSIQTTNIFELSKKLEEALEKENLTPNSIVIKTEER